MTIYAIERIASVIENFTSETRDILTNPLGLGIYLRKLAEKDDPLAYIPALFIVALPIYFIAAKYGTERSQIMTLGIFSFIAVLMLVYRYWENSQKAQKN